MSQAGTDSSQGREQELQAEIKRLRARVQELSGEAVRGVSGESRTTSLGRDQLLSMVEKTRVPMILTDPNQPDDPIIFVNRAFQELSGYSSDELVGRNCRFLQGSDTDPAQVAAIRQALAERRDIAIEILNYRRDGTPFVNELYISPVFDQDGRLLYHFGSQIDVTGYSRDRRRLEDSERRQRAIFESAVEFAIVATDRDGRVTDWNSGAEAVFGWTASEMRDETAERFFTPEDRLAGRIETEMRLSLEDGRAKDERWHLRKDGTRFWASGEMMPLADECGHAGFIKVLRDRTAEHEAGRRLAVSEERYRTLFETVETGFCIVEMRFDAAGRAIDYRIVEANPAFERLTGQAGVTGKWVSEFAPTLERHWFDTYGRVALTGEPVRFENAAEAFGRWYDVQALRIGDPAAHRVAVLFNDISERRSVELALARSEEHWRGLFERVQEGVLIAEVIRNGEGRVTDWRYLDVNPAWAELIGIPTEAVVGHTVRTLIPGIEDAWIEEAAHVVATGTPAVFTRQVGPLGRWYEGRVYRLGPDRFTVIFQEVTDRRSAEQRRRAILELGDRLREEGDPTVLILAGCELIGRTLGAGRVGYGVVEPDGEILEVERDWTTPGYPSLAGKHHISSYGLYADNLRRGEVVVIPDVREDPGTVATSSTLEAIATRTLINLPIVEGGRVVALLYVNDGQPRSWTADEVAFAQDAVERLRQAIERRRAETRLRASEERLRTILDTIQAAFAIVEVKFDAEDRPVDYRFVEANPAFERQAGVNLRGKWVTEFAPDLEQFWFDTYGHVARTGEPAEFESYAKAFGRWFDVLAVRTGDPSERQIAIIFTDSTARREAEDRLRASEALARTNIERVQLALAAGAIIGTWHWDLPTDRFTVDEGFATAFGLDPALGHSGIPLAQIVAMVHPDDQASLAAAIGEVIARGGSYAQQYRVRQADGRYHWIEANGRVDHAPDGTPQSFPGVLLDVEGRRAVELERDRATAELRALTETLEQRVRERTADLMLAEEQLRQSQKMEAVGQLTGGLAHDFNNLLTGMTGSLELLKRRMAQGRLNDVDRYVEAAQGAANRAAALTHRLLAFSRRQTLDPKPTDVNRLVAGMEDLVRRTVGPEIAVDTAGAADLWATLVDPGQLENALLNLCINARDAMPDGGRITIETANRRLDPRNARERDMEAGEYVSLCVSDTGTGMPPEVVAKALDPFFTTKPIGQGTGLGLSMIYGFTKQSGGQIRIHSEVGRGTTVCLYLPRHGGDAEQSESVPELADAPRAEAGQTVLVVDDEPTVRMLVSEVLVDLGYTAIEAADGAAGLKVLQSDARVDLLVTDVGLPGGMNGRQVADAARVVRPELKVLFITGYAENAVLGHGHLEPGMHVLIKPFPLEALASRIKELIAAAP